MSAVGSEKPVSDGPQTAKESAVESVKATSAAGSAKATSASAVGPVKAGSAVGSVKPASVAGSVKAVSVVGSVKAPASVAGSIGPSASQVGEAPAAEPAAIAVVAEPEPEPEIPREPAQKEAPKKVRAKTPRKKAKTSGGGGGGTPYQPNTKGPSGCDALQRMQGNVEVPEYVKMQIAEQQRKADERNKKEVDPMVAYGKHQPGVPRELVGNVQDQDYDRKSEATALSYTYNSAEYTICNVCGMGFASAPYCSMTGKKHVVDQQPPPRKASVVVPPSMAASPLVNLTPARQCNVVPMPVPIERGAMYELTHPGAPNMLTPQYVEDDNETVVTDVLPYHDPHDAEPMKPSELYAPSPPYSGGAQRYAATPTPPSSAPQQTPVDWMYVKSLADQYVAAAGRASGSVMAASVMTPPPQRAVPVHSPARVPVPLPNAGKRSRWSPVPPSPVPHNVPLRSVSPTRHTIHSPSVQNILSRYRQTASPKSRIL
eukprot:TRINITY_DN9003_c0_g2_i2.p1 TRINITY_DN9003_c0_g2~~TRINITY_DN9003_c0_g2_i2.p1  ORF type:complete len:486 (+),score=79.65 TRINITY_DN9003_c0_g2_i2:37-1494(+)